MAPAAFGATGIAQDGSFRAEFTGPGPGEDALSMYGFFERAGRYLVTVDKAGYQQWKQEGVRVTRDQCHVRTVRLQADLTPIS